ncbi:hypothetical protein IFM89_023784 [Coptis chinensis]|uniref:Uncharacterized protein n=1 Tax=Coptis chinensis TaxID=261450 RepID=A0A835HGT0_9MAGN|nr:hypothetical protein IFM89_023784 [Coptis chinensis]
MNYNIEPRSPSTYFSTKSNPLVDNKVLSSIKVLRGNSGLFFTSLPKEKVVRLFTDVLPSRAQTDSAMGHQNASVCPPESSTSSFLPAIPHPTTSNSASTSHHQNAGFLDKAMSSAVVTSDDWEVCSITQSSTFFTKQGRIMDRSIGSNFKLPVAALQTFISLSVVIFIPIYDRLTNFGLSKVGLINNTDDLSGPAVSVTTLLEEDEPQLSASEHLNQRERRQKGSVVGTPDYLVPEILLGTGHGYYLFPGDGVFVGVFSYPT